MGTLRTLAISILTLSFFTFVALFGRLPALRNTPIGVLHRLIWIHIPGAFYRLDLFLTRGSISSHAARFGHHLLFDAHPYVLIFFLSLIAIAASVFLAAAWQRLTAIQLLPVPLLLGAPYLFTYLATRAAPGQTITARNLEQQLSYYPYDHTLFFPNRVCRTCNLIKPARSKHCSICGICVAKADHHCVWVNNCLGRENYKWFLCLLASLFLLLGYGASLSYVLLKPDAHSSRPRSPTDSLFTRLMSFFSAIGNAIGDSPRIGAVGLLALFTAPLALALFLYHIYLIWAGFTTNESGKWADLRDSMDDGIVWVGKRLPYPAERASWPVTSDQIVVSTRDGRMPTFKAYGSDNAPIHIVEDSWIRCRRLAEVENIYDLGFGDNFGDAFNNFFVDLFRSTHTSEGSYLR